MLKRITDGVDHICLAGGPADFKKQIPGLTQMIPYRFRLDFYVSASLFHFCNKEKIWKE